MNLARLFESRVIERTRPRRVATFEHAEFTRRYATSTDKYNVPALRRRSKFIPALRVEASFSNQSLSKEPRGYYT